MGELNRQNFLKTLGVVGATLTGIPAKKSSTQSKFNYCEVNENILLDKTTNFNKINSNVIKSFLVFNNDIQSNNIGVRI